MVSQAGAAVKSLVFGPAIPQYATVGLYDPQPEVNVWLHGVGAPRDVTCNNVIACARPLTIGIGLKEKDDAAVAGRSRPSLKFCQRGGENRLLGEIRLQTNDVIPIGEDQLYLFRTKSPRNYCLPRNLVWRRYLHFAYHKWRLERSSHAPEIRMVTSELHALFVSYICPRPVVLVSVADGCSANMFPMDLIGPVGTEHFALALHCTSTAIPLVEHSRRIALSSVPVEQTRIAYELGKNHKVQRVDCDHLPFEIIASPVFGLPMPKFSLRIREMEIEQVRTIGSHKLFLCRTVADQRWSDSLQLFFVQGFYQVWRQQMQSQSAASFR
jgi:flavin reductase (DIM6/NTAB) family NADH-FMN oxidoreductase RutF